MACKCYEIKQHEKDLIFLLTINNKVNALEALFDEVHGEINDLKGYYSATVNASEELNSAFDKLDNNAPARISRLKLSTQSAIERTKEALEALRKEDEESH